MGTVTVPPGRFFCITTWLPRRRTSTNPCRAKIAQASLPDRTRSLPSGNLHLSDVHVAMQALLQLFRRCALEEQLQCLPEVVPGLFNAVPLAGDVQLGAERNVPIAFRFDDCRQPHQSLLWEPGSPR